MKTNLNTTRLQMISAVAVLLFTGSSWASTLAIDNLPAALAAELAVGAVQTEATSGSISSFYSHGGVSAYAFTRGLDSFTLVQYDVLSGSQWDTSSIDPIAQTGSVFVEAPTIYLPGTSAQFTLHFDFLFPGIPDYAFWSGMPQANLELSPEAMAAGSGYYDLSTSYNGGVGDLDANMMWTDSGPFLCIECGFFARFNLVSLDYSGVFLDFDPSDTRTYLFTGYDRFDGSPYGWGLDIAVNPVPLPQALVLLVTALAFLVPLRRRQQH